MPAAKFLMTRICEICGSSFTPKTITSKYCCKKCSDVAYKRKKDKQKKMDAMDAVVNSIPANRDYISISEAMAMFGIGKNTLYRMIRNGVISSINIGQRLTRISKSELSQMMGHTNVKTTQQYAKVVDEKKNQAADAIKLNLNFDKE